MNRVIWWIRRDLRLRDNQALHAATQSAKQVIPVFIIDPNLISSKYAGEKRVAFLFAGLRELDAQLQELGSYLVVRLGDPLEELGRLIQEYRTQAIFAESDYSPYARKRDEKISHQLEIHWVGHPVVLPPGTVVKPNGDPYTVFTSFSKAWKALPNDNSDATFQPPARLHTPTGIHSLPIPCKPSLPEGVQFWPGEKEAQRRLEVFTRGTTAAIYQYAIGRDRQDLDGTSKLSPYLKFGMLSARQAVASAQAALQAAEDADERRGAEAWLNELIWREFYVHVLFHFPHARQRNLRLQSIRWENNEKNFEAWKRGRTGYPIVDAAMRQLKETGWMHNRARMIVASFLTKDLLIDWRWGEDWFMQHLIDGDPAANNGGWQWTAGTGTDAAPYFRIFNPITQGKRHDPYGVFTRQWLPELSNVPNDYIHEPWLMPVETQRLAGCMMGEDYPEPIVDHSWARERVLRVYGQA